MIQIQNLIWSRPPFELRVPEWRLTKGQHALVTGPSGSGKTTLLKLLSGLAKADEGQVRLADRDPSTSNGLWRRSILHLVLSEPSLFPDLNLTQNLEFHTRVMGEKIDVPRQQNLLDELGLLKLMDRLPKQCSSGERQRLTLARAFLHPRPYLFFDEPTSHLSIDHGYKVVETMLRWAKIDNSTMVMVSHRKDQGFDMELKL